MTQSSSQYVVDNYEQVDIFCSGIHKLHKKMLAGGSTPSPSYIDANTGLLAIRNTAWVRKLFLPAWKVTSQTQTVIDETQGDQPGLIVWCTRNWATCKLKL